MNLLGVTKLVLSTPSRLAYKLRSAVNPVAHAKALGVQIGSDCRLIDVNFGSEPYLVSLGDHVSATQTQFITHDGGVWVMRDKNPDIDFVAPIHVGDNVFIGSRSIILPGVTIGSNVVIGAGSVVSQDIPSNVVCAGIPARVISSIEEYSKKKCREAVPTKSMTKHEKKLYLLAHFTSKNQPG